MSRLKAVGNCYGLCRQVADRGCLPESGHGYRERNHYCIGDQKLCWGNMLLFMRRSMFPPHICIDFFVPCTVFSMSLHPLRPLEIAVTGVAQRVTARAAEAAGRA